MDWEREDECDLDRDVEVDCDQPLEVDRERERLVPLWLVKPLWPYMPPGLKLRPPERPELDDDEKPKFRPRVKDHERPDVWPSVFEELLPSVLLVESPSVVE